VAGEPVTATVLAVPAAFNDLQRQAIRDAARIAGLDVRGMVTEPAAAMLGSGLFPAPRGEERKVVVYDLGGGSFDVAAALVTDDGVEIVASGGDAFLGGEDFDQRIVDYLCERVAGTKGGARPDRTTLARLRQVAERAKVDLTTELRVDVRLPPAAPLLSAVIPLDRARLEGLTQDLIDRTMWPCEAVIHDAKWSMEDVDAVVMVGGQTRMPRVRAQLAELFGKPPLDFQEPETLVAIGAARQAAALEPRRGRGRGPVPVAETTGVALGVETAGGVLTRLIPKGTRLPAKHVQMFSTSSDNQTQVVIHLLQGEREMAADNQSIARVLVGSLPPRPRGVAQVEVEIAIDGGGLPRVSARDPATGEAKPVRVRASGGLTEAEIVALAALHAGGPAAAALADDASLPEVVSSDNERGERHDQADPHPAGG
jgi:molecular chaperone DnaK